MSHYLNKASQSLHFENFKDLRFCYCVSKVKVHRFKKKEADTLELRYDNKILMHACSYIQKQTSKLCMYYMPH